MTAFPRNMQEQPSFQWVEFFAGKGEATRMFKGHGFTSARLDIIDMTPTPGRENPLDLCTDSGMAKHALFNMCSSIYSLLDVVG